MSRPQTVRITLRDGIELGASLYHPKGTPRAC